MVNVINAQMINSLERNARKNAQLIAKMESVKKQMVNVINAKMINSLERDARTHATKIA